MIKNVLIPTDFSVNAYNALLYATRLFQNESMHFYVLNSFEEEVTRSTSRVDIGKTDDLVDELVKKTNDELTSLKHSIVRDTEGFDHTFEMISSSRELSKVINQVIDNRSIDLVVMGTKGRTGAIEVLLGSTTVNVIKKIKNAPLLVIPEDVTFVPPKNIGFATGFKHEYSDFELDSIVNIAKLYGSKVDVLHVKEEERISVAQRANWIVLKNKMHDLETDTHWVAKGPSKTEVLTDFVFHQGIDLVAMIYYKHSFIKSLFRESIIKKIGMHPGLPFLMVPSSA